MDHLKRVQDEFTRQADTFDAHAVKADDQVAARFQDAIGVAGNGAILDVACGPGVVTAAMAGTAKEVTAFDATPAMLDKARKRCAEAGLQNVRFEQGNAESMPFANSAFDGVVTRLAIHHFADPGKVIGEIYRVLRPGGTAVIVDVIVSEDAAEAALQNAIEIIRDPSHIRMLPASELDGLIDGAGFEVLSESTWDKDREFEEWMGIANDPQRVGPLRVIARTLAEDGRTAGMGLSIRDDRIVFFHRWRLVAAQKPAA
ncbi:MAG: class I SAM-dependent methyltransferase [Alphaproteobacteria bacterium]|nr:class I SAM-dependent methyltransferase [Alphaproteobacteria bacterium]